MNVTHDGPSGRTLLELLDDLPDSAIHQLERATTKAELLRAIDARADDLASAGVGPGEVVSVQLPNGPDLVAALFAVWRNGSVYAPLNPRAGDGDAAHHLATIRPAARVTVGGIERLEEPRRQQEGVALVQFTSGTTGRPKPVQLTHETVLDMLDRVVASVPKKTAPGGEVRPPMPNLVPLSLSLWAGIYQVLFAFRVGAPAVLMERFETSAFADLVRTHGIRSTVLPPAAMSMLVDDPAITDLAPLRIVRSITAPLSPTHARRFHQRFGAFVLNSYGQTEIGGEVTGWSVAEVRTFGEAKLGSVGRVHAGVELQPDEATGELLVRTPSTIRGAIADGVLDRLLDDGWFRTGDVGRIDEDGFVWIEGRVSDMINRGGNKVFPADVEDALLELPGVREVAVVGVPDERLGEVPWAFLVAQDAPLDDAVLADWCRGRLTPYKVPVGFTWIPELPRNDTGKVVRAKLVADRMGT